MDFVDWKNKMETKTRRALLPLNISKKKEKRWWYDLVSHSFHCKQFDMGVPLKHFHFEISSHLENKMQTIVHEDCAVVLHHSQIKFINFQTSAIIGAHDNHQPVIMC